MVTDTSESKGKAIILTFLPPVLYSTVKDLWLPTYPEDETTTDLNVKEYTLKLSTPKSSLIKRFEFATLKELVTKE